MGSKSTKSSEIIETRRRLLEIERLLDYPRYSQCPCQSTTISRNHDKLYRAISSAIKATEALIIYYLDNEHII